MLGYQVIFYVQQDQKHKGMGLSHWLLHRARELNIGEAALFAAAEAVDKDHKLHSARFFEQNDQHLQVQMILPEPDVERLFAAIDAEGLNIFYIKLPVDMGVTGESSAFIPKKE